MGFRARAAEPSECGWHTLDQGHPCRTTSRVLTTPGTPGSLLLAGLKAGGKKKKSKKQKTGDGGDGDGDGGGGGALFSGDGINTARPGKLSVAAGGDKDAFKTVGRFGGKLRSQLSKTELNKLKRQGKGKSSFKSKSRFKRR